MKCLFRSLLITGQQKIEIIHILFYLVLPLLCIVVYRHIGTYRNFRPVHDGVDLPSLSLSVGVILPCDVEIFLILVSKEEVFVMLVIEF